MNARYDLDALRAAVSIHDVLAGASIEITTRSKRIRCPIHDGDNASAFSFDEQRFRCFVCEARGDVFELSRALHKLTFREAVEHVARVGGVALSAAPRATQQQIEQRATISQRRAALRDFREHRLNQLAVELYELDRLADGTGATLTALRDTKHEDAAWDSLAAVHYARDAAEYERTLLEEDSEATWLHVLAEHKRDKCEAQSD